MMSIFSTVTVKIVTHTSSRKENRMTTKVERKRTQRNLNSKRKRWLRNRGMSPSYKFTIIPWRERYAALDAAYARPLRGVRADLRSTIPKSTVPKKQSLASRLVRLFRRPNA
jgi:hypothetical protein